MSYEYTDLLKVICSSIAKSGKNCPDLVLYPSSQQLPPREDGRLREAPFEVPEALIPEGAEPVYLTADETFLDAAEDQLLQNAPDVVFAIPPWVRDNDLSREWRNRNSRLGLIEAFAEQVFQPPTPASGEQLELGSIPVPYRQNSPDTLILFVPRGILEQHRTGQWRSLFFKQHATTIIEHDHPLHIPGFDLHLHARFRAVTLVMQREPGPVRFFKVLQESMEDEDDRLLNDLQALLKKQGGETVFGHVYRGNLTPDYPTTFDFYSPATQKLRENIKDLSQKVSLEEVADIFTGFLSMRMREAQADPTERIRYVSGRNILANGEFDLSELRQTQGDQNVQRLRFLEEGDIVVRRIRNPRGAAFIAAVFPRHREQLAFDQSVIVIRPKPFIEPEQRMVILAFLRSSMARDLFIAKGDAITLENHVLREFPVPLADEDLITAIKGLTEARNAFAGWTAKLDLELSEIVSNRNMKESRMNLLSAGQLARQRYRAASQVEELDYRIRTQYPLPLAYLWRDWQVSSPDAYRSLRNILKAAEGFTCFFALTALLVGRISNIRIGYIEQIAGRLADRGGGTNFGDWFAILKEVGSSKKFREQQNSVPFFEVTEMMRSEPFEEALRLLMTTRNDDSHGRLNPNAIPASLLKNLEKALVTIYEHVGFVSDYGLIQIKRSRLDTIRKLTSYEYADLKGDNPLVPVHKGETGQTELEIDSLYLRDRSDHLHLFRPYLHYLECPECHLMSTFYLDTYQGSGSTVGLKSFERNSIRSEDLADEFKWAGLLKK